MKKGTSFGVIISVVTVLVLSLLGCASPKTTPTLPTATLTPTISGTLMGLPSSEGAAASCITTLRAVKPDTGEVVAAILLKESFDYQMRVPAGLYLFIATAIDLQSGEGYLGFGGVLRMKSNDSRQLDIPMESGLVIRHGGLPGEASLVKSARLYIALPTALLEERTVAASHTVSEVASDVNLLPAKAVPVVISLGDFSLTQGTGVKDMIDHDLGGSDVAMTELFKAMGDKYTFVDTSSVFQEGIRRGLEFQRAGRIDPDTEFEYHPLTPQYEVRGKVHVSGIYETGLGDLGITLELVDKKTGRVLVTHTAEGKEQNIRDFFALTTIGINSENDFGSKLVTAIKQDYEAAQATPKSPSTPTQTPARAMTFSGGPYIVSLEKTINRVTQSFNMKMNMTLTWQGDKGTMTIPTDYWREITSGGGTLAGVAQDSNVFNVTLAGTNDTITGSATASFKSGEGSFAATAEFNGRVTANGDSVTGTLQITSEVINQSVSVALNRQ